MVLSCNNVTKSFGVDVILNNVSFHVNEGERTAIVGVNGAGKSTLLNILTGRLLPDAGDVTLSKGISLGYLTQEQNLTSEHAIWDEMMDAKRDVLEIDRQIRKLEMEMKSANEEDLQRKLHVYAKLTHEFEIKNGYALQSEVKGILKGLGFEEDEISLPIRNLSGGWKTRVALGKLLLQKPDLILLDEPTNHLDVTSITWLENYLTNYKGTVLIVSHDRYFLNRIVTKVIEIEHAKVQTYLGNYSDYSKKKAKQREDWLKRYYDQQNEIRHHEEVIAKLRSFNREKSIRKAESREKMLAKIERIEKPVTNEPTMRIHLNPRIAGGNDVLSVRNLSKSYGDRVLFSNVNFEIKRGERIALIGDNGTGKTTILKIIHRLIDADYEEIKLGTMVKTSYYDQEHEVLNPKNTLFDELREAHPQLNDAKLRNVLAAFLFTGDDVFKRVGDLSGGEKGRVSLAKLMLSDANFLILDEPTNHLDVLSKEILENALAAYSGTVLFVSHDRYFVNQTATGVLHLNNGTLTKYIGNYDYFMEKREDVKHAKKEETNPDPRSQSKTHWKLQKEEQSRIRKLKNALAKTEEEIQEWEREKEVVDSLMASPDIATNAEKLLQYSLQKEEIGNKLDALLETWEELSEQVD